MNRPEALSVIGVGGLAAVGLADGPENAWSPAMLIGEAIHLAEAHVKAEKIDVSGHYLSGAVFKADGTFRWEVRWDGTDRLVKGNWFVVRIGMDKKTDTAPGL